MVECLLSRDEAVEIYRQRALTIAPTYAAESSRFPPLLCRNLLTAKPVELKRWSPFLGYGRPRTRTLTCKGREMLVVADFDVSELLLNVPITAHFGAVEQVEALIGRTESAINLLASIPDCNLLTTVFDWTSMVVWLTCSVGANQSALTSSTFPSLPHCTFLTTKALRHLPPLNIADDDQDYCLAENLYHEALHQQLSTTFALSDCVSANYDCAGAVRIEVPWRGQQWEPDRVVHAVYVYAHLIRLRSIALTVEVGPKAFLESALSGGFEALEFLTDSLDECRPMFSEAGLQTFEAVQTLARNTLSLSRQSLQPRSAD